MNGFEWDIEDDNEHNDASIKEESIWYIIRGQEIKLAIGVIYMAVDNPQNRDWNDKLEEKIARDIHTLKDEGMHILLLGDFNGHIREEDGGVPRGDPHTDKNGQRVVNFCSSHDLSILNCSPQCEGKWTWMRRDSRSIIDYMLLDNRIKENCRGMMIDDEGKKWPSDSDHNWMQMEIECHQQVKKQKATTKPRWKIHPKTNWENFRNELKEKLVQWNEVMNSVENKETMVELGYNKLVSVLQEVGEKTIGRSSGTRYTKDTRKIKRAILHRNKAGKRWKDANRRKDINTVDHWKSFQEKKKAVASLKKKQDIKNKYKWRIKLAEEGGTSSKSLWSSLSEKNKDSKIEALKIGKEIITDPEHIKREIEGYFKELGREPNKSKDPNDELHNITQNKNKMSKEHNGETNSMDEGEPPKPPDPDEVFERPITEAECKEAIRKLKKGKASGWDDIPNDFIKEGGQHLMRALTKLFEMMREAEWTPDDWSKEKKNLLHKGKSKQHLDNYRGISISSNIGKLFTRILAQRLESIIEQNGWLGEIQGGFRKGRGTMDHLFVLTSLMDRAHKLKKPIYIAFIDLRKAFDRVWREGLWKCLGEYGLGGKFLSIVKSLYNDHKCKIETVGGSTEWINCERGVKQGCVLSPMLFALYIAKLGNILQSESEGITIGKTNIPGLFFADDMTLIAETEQNLKSLLQKVKTFTDERRLEINFSKTKIMKTGPHTSEEHQWIFEDALGIQSEPIQEANFYEYLGILIGRSRTFSQFLKMKINKLPQKIGFVKTKAKSTPDRIWAADVLWKLVVKPSLLYGAEVVTYNKTWLTKIEAMQCKIGRWILGVSYRCSATGVRGELGWTSLQGEISKLKVGFLIHLGKLKQSRWPRVILEEILSGSYDSNWYNEVNKAREIINDIWEISNSSNWRNKLSEQWRKTEDTTWREEKSRKKHLEYYPIQELSERQQYIDGSASSISLCKLRLGDFITNQKKDDEPDKCPVCKLEMDATNKHIILDCNTLQQVRVNSGLQNEIDIWENMGKTRNEIVRIILEDTCTKNKIRLHKLLTSWKTQTEGVEKP